MAIGRFFSHLKRKLRIILICVAAVTFTVTLAFYNAEEVSVREIPLRPKILPKIVDHGAMPDENKVETEKYVQVVKEEIKPKEPAITDAVKQSEEQNDKDQKQYSHELFNTNVSEIATVPKQQQASYSSVTYPPLKEFVGEFDTADIYKHVIAQQGGPFGATNISRSSSSGKLRVFILPFTHVDPGWLRTFDSYSEDTNKILDNMHFFMTKNPAMRFMWAEFVFFERWWKLKNETIKQDVRKMIEEGRLELASGSWVMTDEANAYFPVSVDNIVEGHQFLQKELGMKASTIWSNDPFGYSNSVPYLFRQTGIKRNVINRIHHGIKGYLQGHKGIPFQWRQYFENSESDDVLTHVLPYTHYDILNSCGPNAAHCCEFDFKRMTHWSCPGPKPVAITPANVAEKAGRLVSELKTMAQLYEAPVLLQMHGDDFRFDMIEEWHQHHDNFLPLFTEINKGNEVEISFGTFNDYFTELEKFYEKEKKQPAILTGDFFPYKCALGDLWTGYYTTRPFYKRQGRLLHNLIRSADIASAFNPSNSENVKALEGARRTLSLFQHHDAITGTSKIHVMKDYSSLLFQAQTKANAVLQSALKQSLKTEISVTHSATLFNETQTKHQIILDSAAAYVSIYNPLPYVLSDTVSVRVNSTRLSVSSGGKTVPAQIEPYIYKGDVAQDSYLLTFSVKLSPLGVTVVELKEGNGANVVEINALAADTEKIQKVLPKPFKVTEIAAEQLQLATSRLSTSHDPNTGLLTAIKSFSSGTHKARMSLIAYRNSMGGAYLMRVRSEAQSYIPSSVPKMLVKGPVQQSIHSFMGNVYQRITAKQVDGVLGDQLDVHVRINILKETNTEVAMRLETDFEAPQVFADSVGMQLLKRESHAKLDTAANYYPMPSAAVVEDGKTRLTIGSNVEHGMKEIPRGVEIMIDRILNQDDGKGLGSTADAIPTDMLPVDMQFSVLFEKKTQKDETAHYSAHTPSGHLSVQNVLYPPVVAVSSEKPSPLSTDSLPALPCDYQLLTVRPIQDNKKMLILFRHGTAAGAETNESCGTDVTAAVKSLLSAIKVTKVQETNLSGTENVGSEKTVSEVVVNIEPFKFLALIAS